MTLVFPGSPIGKVNAEKEDYTIRVDGDEIEGALYVDPEKGVVIVEDKSNGRTKRVFSQNIEVISGEKKTDDGSEAKPENGRKKRGRKKKT
jgi:hypothetical protein